MNRMHIQLSKIMYLCVPNTIHFLLLISEEQVPSSADFSYLGHDVLIFRGEIVTHSGGAYPFAKCIKCPPPPGLEHRTPTSCILMFKQS